MEDVQVLVIVDKLPLDTYVNERENKKGLYLSHFYLGFSVTVKSIQMTEKEPEMKMQPMKMKHSLMLGAGLLRKRDTLTSIEEVHESSFSVA